MHPICIDDDGVIQKLDSPLRAAFNMFNNASLPITKIWMNEEEYKDIIKWESIEVTCNSG